MGARGEHFSYRAIQFTVPQGQKHDTNLCSVTVGPCAEQCQQWQRPSWVVSNTTEERKERSSLKGWTGSHELHLLLRAGPNRPPLYSVRPTSSQQQHLSHESPGREPLGNRQVLETVDCTKFDIRTKQCALYLTHSLNYSRTILSMVVPSEVSGFQRKALLPTCAPASKEGKKHHTCGQWWRGQRASLRALDFIPPLNLAHH